MKKCARCGKRGPFLHLDENGLCEDCQRAAAIEAENSWDPIVPTFGADVIPESTVIAPDPIKITATVCKKESSMSKHRFEYILHEVGGAGTKYPPSTWIIRDTETGVCYLLVTHASSSGLTPLLGADGKPIRM